METERRPRGRPRAFDRDAALDAALGAFWRWGYEAASIALLTEVMGITAPSLYAAFGSKKELYLEALDRYLTGGPGPLVVDLEPTARAGVARWLAEAARDFTADPTRLGCFVVCSTQNHGPESADVAALLRKRRRAGEAMVRARIERGIAEGEIDGEVDAAVLAKHFAVVFHGMSVQARDGASAAELARVAELAMRAWPDAPRGGAPSRRAARSSAPRPRRRR